MHGLHSGSVDLKNASVANSSYIWQYTPDPLNENDWTTGATTMQASHTIDGLKPGVKYWFRVCAVTRTGQQPFCDPIMLLVI
jgi:hypothetical protein